MRLRVFTLPNALNVAGRHPPDWFEWSTVVECPRCGGEVAFAEAKKLKAGIYQCPHCRIPIKSLTARRRPDQIVRLKLQCQCGFKDEKKPDKYDFEKYQWIEDNFGRIVKERDLWYPKDKIFLGEKTRELLSNGYKYFYELFTKRNLLSLMILSNAIKQLQFEDPRTQEMFFFIFSSTLRGTNKFCFIPQKWQGGRPSDWPGHDYWTPNVPLEWRVWGYFERCYKKIIRGKTYSQDEIGNYWEEAKSFSNITDSKSNCYLFAKSATDLKEIPDESVDVIITDPPYGANVNYTELSDFWTIWLRDIIGVRNGLIDNTKEAIENKYQGKGSKEYRQLMYEIFKECYRVLKPNRWLVMTFHNRNFKVWNAIHLAVHDAGFVWSEKDGMIYQGPISPYTNTYNLRAAGSMLGDFILSYKKAEKPPGEKWVEEVEVGKKIKDMARQAIEYHGGAKLTTIYMRVMPFLLNSELLDQIKESDLESYLRKDFVKRDDKWYLKEHIDEKTDSLLDKAIEEYAPVKTRLESIIRRFLYQCKTATMDEILRVVYSRLINSNAAEYEEIVHVVNRICAKVKGKGIREAWQLKEDRDRGLLFRTIEEKMEKYKYSEESEHDVMIEQLVKIGKSKGYDSHIGLTEQKKYKEFKELSIPMGSNVQFGLNEIAFNRVREIDVLWVKGISIVAALEVEKSREVAPEIAKFRELFAATPALNIPTYLVVPDKLEGNAKKKIGSLANRRDGLTERIRYVLFSDIQNKKDVDIDKIAKEVI
ncbi:MAG: hypothetical protein COX49_01925 [bacterium (Candidatus Stahlbacteria) CG23_combo_of_CG06-09_8_20_14_all_40_9]|nr:MAG: hypothetical protein COX49_01925 [bacterium (Candidatus Stahlbacteria) CG23_combo_of_CG06-09_8_20_14_all_40_9]